ncbi:MAG TPA: hypothetical protein VKF59_03195 [Candidatus Dormibacteraeota bacterium]|nr:hypothetical protein [Candidatus Dormibacteraeota bacterium]
MAVFLGSFLLLDRSRPVEQRMALVPLMLLVDMFPRVTLISMVPVGLAVAWLGRWAPLPGWVVAIAVLVSAVWLAAVVRQFRRPVVAVRRADLAWRVLLMLAAFGLGVASVAGAGPFPSWLGLKVALFGLILAAGLWIRIIPFELALQELGRGSTPEREDAYARVQARALVPVLTIWGSLVLMTFLSVAKPAI